MSVTVDPSAWSITFGFDSMRLVFDLGILTGRLWDTILKALIVGLLTSVCAAMLGVPLVLKRYSMIGDGLSHTGFFALAIAAAFSVSAQNQLYVTLPLVVGAAVVLLLLSESGKIKGDSAIAILSTGAVALGYIVYSIFAKSAGDVCSSLFGTSIMVLDMGDVMLSCVLAVFVIAAFVFLYNKIFAVTFDPAFAKSAGSPVKLLSVLIAVLSAVTIVVGMKMIGAIMISALVVFPALAAMRVCKRFRSVIAAAASISALCFLLGLFFSTVMKFQFRFNHFADSQIPMGPCVVFMNILALLVCIIIAGLRKKKAKKRSLTAVGQTEQTAS